jgi:hypothetical protein
MFIEIKQVDNGWIVKVLQTIPNWGPASSEFVFREDQEVVDCIKKLVGMAESYREKKDGK